MDESDNWTTHQSKGMKTGNRGEEGNEARYIVTMVWLYVELCGMQTTGINKKTVREEQC